MASSERAITAGTYTYTPIGSVAQILDALGHSRTYGYDGRGRRVSINDPNGGAWQLSYTNGNDLEQRIDATGNRVRFSYDDFGRPQKEWHQLGGQPERLAVEYHYDDPSPDHMDFGETRGMLAWLEDEAGREYYNYDARGRTTDTIRRWDDGTEHHTWNDYDSLGRVIRRGFPDKTYLSMSYDARGLLRQLGPIANDITWNAHGALDSYKLGNGLMEKRTYDDRRRLVAMSTADSKGNVVRGLRYGLDAASRIVEIADLRTSPPPDEDLTASFQYDDRYRLTSATYRTGATNWQHDDVAKVQSVTSDFGDPHLNVTNAYGENGAGPDALTHHGTEALTYDDAGRVTKDGERSYEWDAKGRVSKVTRGKVVEQYVYGHDDSRAVKLTTVDGKTEVTRYIEKDVEERAGALVRYAYLGEQRLARLDPADVGPRTAPVTKTGNANSVVASDNNSPDLPRAPFDRVCRVWSAPWAIFALALSLIVLIARAAKMRWTLLIPSTALRLAGVAASLSFAALGGLTVQACSSDHGSHIPTFREQSVEITTVPDGAEFYLDDAQQSPLAVVSKAASVLSRTALHPFGHVRFQSSKLGDPWGFVGNEEDRGSEISDFHARPYRPELGVFLAVDPVAMLTPEKLLEKPRAFAAYLYAISDPINNSDPDGLEPNKGFWTRVGQGAIHLIAETICMSLGGCGYANAPAPGQRTYPSATPAQVALNLTAAHVAPRIDAAIASRILKGAPARILRAAEGPTPAADAVKTKTAIQPYFPSHNGFLGETTRQTLTAGQQIDRYGGSGYSRFFSPPGTPAAARALPPGTASQPLRTFEVLKPFEVEAGTVAPAFGEPGFGTQFRAPAPLDTLLKRGILREVTR